MCRKQDRTLESALATVSIKIWEPSHSHRLAPSASAPVTCLEPHLCARSCSGRGGMRLTSISPVVLLKNKSGTSLGERKWLQICQGPALPFPKPSLISMLYCFSLEQRIRRLKHHKQQALRY